MAAKVRLVAIIAFTLCLIIPLLADNSISDADFNSIGYAPEETRIAANIDETTPWWNLSYYYRVHVNLTDVNSTRREDVPTHIFLTFEENTCFEDSIRVIDHAGEEIPSQVYNETHWDEGTFLKSATIFWYAGIEPDSTSTYWIYYSEDTSIETSSYESVVWFARTTGTLSGKFSPNFWSFKGDWYNVTMYNEAGGKMTNGAHKMADGSWNWNWGTNRGSMHWNPDGLGGSSSTYSVSPISGTTFVNVDGPLFINYTTQIPFGSYAKINVTYTFYKWGWIFRTWIEYTGETSGSGRTDEWVFYPYITNQAIEVAVDGTQTYHESMSASTNKGLPAGFGWFHSNGISHGTVRVSHDSWNTNPEYPNGYDDYYYRWNKVSAYEYWDAIVSTIYAIPGTVLEETCAFAVWNGSEGVDGYMRIFNATSRYLPIQRAISDVSSYSFRINVKDLGLTNIEGVNVSLIDIDTGERLLRTTGEPFTALTDSNGNVTFIGLINKTYGIAAWIDSRSWLQEQPGATGMNVTYYGEHDATGPFTPVGITLELASITINLRDLMDDSLGTTGGETIQVRIYNKSDSNPANWRYMDQQNTDDQGDLMFYRIPRCEWLFNFSYTNTDTGRIYQWKDFAQYGTYTIPSSDITDHLHRDWVLPLVTLDFNVVAYDDLPVENAYIRLSKKGTGDPYPSGDTDSKYNVTHYTDSDGNVEFYRVLNGTWTVFLYKNDDYGQLTFNNSVVLNDIQSADFTQMRIPLTSLRVLVEDEVENRVTNAEIQIIANGVNLVIGYSDSSGWHNFTYIKANDTSISWSYTVTVTKSGTTVGPYSVYASLDFFRYNTIVLAQQDYLSSYTELNCTISAVSWSYARNGTFTVGWYNRTSIDATNYVDTPLENYSLGWLNFTVKHDGMIIGFGTWNSISPLFIEQQSEGSMFFTVAIDTLLFKMNVSDTPYTIELTAHALGYADPAVYKITVFMVAAQTTPKGDTSATGYWNDGFALIYSLYTAPHNRSAFNVTDLDYYNYTVVNSLNEQISSGNMVHLGDGLYRFSDAILNGSNVGSYKVYMWLHKANYVNRSRTLSVTINPLETELEWAIQPIPYTWGLGTYWANLTLTDTSNEISVPEVDSVTLEWIDESTGIVIVIDASDTLNYEFSGLIVANGTWRIRATFYKANYVSDTIESDVFVVSAATTEIDITSSDTMVINWGQYAEFDFIFQHVSGPVPVSGAGLLGIAWTGDVHLIDNGDGSYRLRLLAVQEAFNYSVSLSMWIANRTCASAEVYVNVLIPLTINSESGLSPQDPIEEYWTRYFNISLIAGDLSNGSAYVSGVIISYSLPAAGIEGHLEENEDGQYYWFAFAASRLPEPGVYEISITAQRVGCQSISTSIHIRVLATPTTSTTPNQILTVFYADVNTLNFTWMTTIDDELGITDPDEVTISLWKGTSLLIDVVGGVIELGEGIYEFGMDTRAFGMTADYALSPTTYFFTITLVKTGYQTPLTLTIIILVLETPTQMTSESVEPVVWSDSFTVRVHLQDIIHDEFIWIDAVVTFNYGSFVGNFASLGNGTFVFTCASNEVFSASATPYTATVKYSLPNYVDGQVDVSILVNPMGANILASPLISSYDWGDTFNLVFDVIINGTTTRIEVTTAQYYWLGYPSINGSLVYDAVFNRYMGTVNTGKVPAGNRVLCLVASKQNYSINTVQIPLEIRRLSTSLIPTEDGPFVKVFGVDRSMEIRFRYTYAWNDTALLGATITFTWAGLERTASFSNGEYVFQFDPSADTSLEIPGSYELSFTASLANHTTSTTFVTLKLVAATEVRGGPFRIEQEQALKLIFTYWDVVNDQPVAAAVVQYQIGTSAPVTLHSDQFNGTHYILVLSAEEIGEVRPDPYQIRILASAPGYQNWTASELSQHILVYVDPPTIGILGLRIQRDTVMLVLFMVAIFGAIVGGGALVKRWRIPYQIKQINKAIKAMENNNKAKVEKIKNMGMIVSELLTPGLAELDLPPPMIDVISAVSYEEMITDETEELLDELDALDDISADDADAADAEKEDFAAELEAELDSAVDEVPEVEAEDLAEEPEDAELETQEPGSEEDAAESIEETDLELEEDVDVEDTPSEDDGSEDMLLDDSEGLEGEAEDALESEESSEDSIEESKEAESAALDESKAEQEDTDSQEADVDYDEESE